MDKTWGVGGREEGLKNNSQVLAQGMGSWLKDAGAGCQEGKGRERNRTLSGLTGFHEDKMK